MDSSFSISFRRFAVAALPYAAVLGGLDALSLYFTGTGGFMLASAAAVAFRGVSQDQRSAWVVSQDGIASWKNDIRWRDIARVEIDLSATPYQRVRISASDGRMITIALGLIAAQDFRDAVAACAPASLLHAALTSPQDHPYPGGARYAVAVSSILGLALIGVPYAVWIAVNAR